MKKSLRGFTLIELMIVVAIIGLLAAVAIPSYQDYTTRSQVSEAFSLTAAFKQGLTEYYSDRGTWPTSLTNIGTTTSGKYVGSITLDSGGTNVTVTATMNSAGVSSNVTNSTFLLVTTDGGLHWTCDGGDILAKYRASACK